MCLLKKDCNSINDIESIELIKCIKCDFIEIRENRKSPMFSRCPGCGTLRRSNGARGSDTEYSPNPSTRTED